MFRLWLFFLYLCVEELSGGTSHVDDFDGYSNFAGVGARVCQVWELRYCLVDFVGLCNFVALAVIYPGLG